MKKQYLIIPMLGLALLVPVSAHAKLQERLEGRIERQEGRIEVREEQREQRQEGRQEKRSENAENHAVGLEKRFTAYYTRLNTLIGKIQARIDASTTKNTTEAQAKLSVAKTKLAEAKTLGDSAVSQFKAIDPAKWEEQKTELKAARDTAQKARLAYVDTVKLMNESVKSLKSAPAK